MARVLVVVVVLSILAAPTTVLAASRIVVVPDVHGDLAQLLTALRMSEIINGSGDWIAGNTTLVQVGDLVDRGPDDLEVIHFFMNLTREAPKSGGKVVCLLGNHELMNLEGHVHYVHEDSMRRYGGKHEHTRMFAEDHEIGKFIRSMPIVHREMRTIFVHAGLSPTYAKEGVDGINKQAADAIHTKWYRSHLFGSRGPVWTRSVITDAESNQCDGVREVLALLDADRMVIGHTPQRGGHIETLCDDMLIAADVGMSRWMYGSLALLELTDVDDTGKNVEMREIAPEEKPSAAYDDAEDIGMEEALKGDPDILQEMLQVLHEKRDPEEEL